MIKYAFHFLALTLLIFNACSPQQKEIKIAGSDDIAILKKMEFDWLAAEFERDTAFISPMIDETFISIEEDGLHDKQQNLKGMYDNITRRLQERHVVDSFYLDDMRIQLYDSAAVVTFYTVTQGRVKDVPFKNKRWRFYDVWVKRNGKWRAVASQGTPVS
ncbi:MAG: nuclear transport factor 2 family protein [Ferruginibacter sp.]